MKKIILLVLIFIIYFILVFKFNIYIPCLFHKITNLYCPGCGVTRMIVSLLKGNLYQAFRYNMLIFILTPFLMFFIFDYIISRKKQRDALYEKIPNSIWYILIIILVIFGIIRNIFPFFAPTII